MLVKTRLMLDEAKEVNWYSAEWRWFTLIYRYSWLATVRHLYLAGRISVAAAQYANDPSSSSDLPPSGQIRNCLLDSVVIGLRENEICFHISVELKPNCGKNRVEGVVKWDNSAQCIAVTPLLCVDDSRLLLCKTRFFVHTDVTNASSHFVSSKQLHGPN